MPPEGNAVVMVQVPAPGAHNLLHNSDFAAGSSFWSLWTESPEVSKAYIWGVDWLNWANYSLF